MWATSSALPIRRMGMLFFNASFAKSVIASVIAVSINPGATALTQMPQRADSFAAYLVSPTNPALLAA